MENNFIKEYGRVVGCFLFLILLFLAPRLSLASNQCSKNGYTIAIINGINTTEVQAKDNLSKLEKTVGFSWDNQEINYQYLYNPTHTALGDLWDAAIQKYDDATMSDIQDSDFAEMLTDASNKVATQKLLLIGHSQGNFYANTFYDTVVDATGGVPSESLGVYAVATPANRVSGVIGKLNDTYYTTSDTDQAIDHISGILKPNVHIDFKDSDDGGLGHDFSKIYLAYEGAKIVSDINTSLNKLKTNNIQNENSPCIVPPKLTMAQKAQGAVLSMLDPVTITAQNVLVAFANGVSNVALAIAKPTINFTASALSSIDNFLIPGISPSNPNTNTNTLTENSTQTIPTQNTSTQDVTSTEPVEQVPVVPENISTENSTPAIPIVSAPLILPPVGKGASNTISYSLGSNSTLGRSSTGEPGDGAPLLDQGGGGNSNPVNSSSPPSPVSDTTPPVITILGNKTETVVVGSTYTDAGATALDDIDGVVNVVASGTVDTTKINSYNITYTATDSTGNVATATRVVNVIAAPVVSLPPTPSLSTFTIDENTTLAAGEYTYENLVITNDATLTLQGDPNSVNSFKGVKINAVNITIDPGSYISANLQGYGAGNGPGVSLTSNAGASYGGVGNGNTSSTIYGSATKPLDLGSGGEHPGGGAIYLNVSNTFTDNGTVVADGGSASSGGSIYVTTKNITGNGYLDAYGGGIGYTERPGGGGRIAVYYQTSSFSGTAEAPGGCGYYSYPSKTCGQDGTVGFFDTNANDLYINNSWEFLKSDMPLSFNNIYISNGAKVTDEDGVNVTAKNMVIDQSSSIILADNQILNIPTITIDGGSALTLSGSGKITASSLIVTGDSLITVLPEQIFSLTVSNLRIDSGSSISTEAKGYASDQGPGAPVTSNAGASYGGVGYLNSSNSTYGSETNPTDFGSGGLFRGGGSIQLTISNTLENDGMISSDGGAAGSGGSVNVNTNNLTGTGEFAADGGGLGYSEGPGGGGRLAIYYQKSSFNGIAEANGGCGYYSYPTKTCGQDGTVHIVDQSIPPKSPLKAITAFNFSSFTPIVSGDINETNHTISLTVPFGADVTALVPTINISDKASISPNNIAQNFINQVTYTVTAEDNSIQNYLVTVTITPNPNPTPPVTSSNTLNQLKIITAPQTISANTASSIITVESQDNTGVLTKVSSTTHVNLSSSSATGVFASGSASNNSCGTDWSKTSITISTEKAHESFCYKDSAPGMPTITVSADGFSSDSQVFTIN